MNLNNFNRIVNPVIIQRGALIHEEERFSDFEKCGDTYTMTAHGTEDYEVSVTVENDGNVVDFDCDCPYHQGPVCKHVVALLFTIIEKRGSRQDDALSDIEDPRLEDRIEKIVASFDRKTLETLLVDQARRSPELFKHLTYHYDEHDNTAKLAKATVREAVRFVEENDGMMDYEGYEEDPWDMAYPLIDEVFENAVEAPTLLKSAQLFNAVIEACMESVSVSSDFVSVVLDDAVMKFRELLVTREHDSAARCACYEEMERFHLEHEEELLEATSGQYLIAMAMAGCEKSEAGFHEILTGLEQEYRDDEQLKTRIEVAKYHHLSRFHDDKTTRAYLYGRLDNAELLKHTYAWAMEDEDFTMAVRCAERMVQNEGTSWKRQACETLLIDALRASGEHERAKRILKAHTLNGKETAFEMYESYFEGDALEREIDELLKELHPRNEASKQFIRIAERHRRYEALMTYVERHPHAVVPALRVLPERYIDRVYAVFERLVLKIASGADDRGHYRSIAKMLKDARKALGTRVDGLAGQLMSIYPRKRALRDELQKALRNGERRFTV